MNYEIIDGIMKISIPDELELNNAQDVKRFVYEQAFGKGFKYVILDFSQTHYIDSTGIGVIVALHKQALANAGAVAFVNMDQNIKNLLKMTALDRVLNIFDTLEEAVRFLRL